MVREGQGEAGKDLPTRCEMSHASGPSVGSGPGVQSRIGSESEIGPGSPKRAEWSVETASRSEPYLASIDNLEAPPRQRESATEAAPPPPRQGAGPKGPDARPPRGSRRRPQSPWGWFQQFLVTGLFLPIQLLTFGLLGAAVFVNATLPDLPDVEKGLRGVQLQEPLRVYSADGALIAEFGVERRTPVSYDRLPPLLINAFLATEDSRFFEHGGIDAVGMGRALVNYASTGIKSQGGSTITMQVTRNFFLSPEKTFTRKLAVVLLALHVEKTLTKEEILELYLNQIFFGHRSYGIVAAAANYYGKDLSQLSVAEMARHEIIEHYGAAAAAQGLKVTTTIESWLQNAAQQAVRKALRQYERRHGYRGPEAQVDLAGASEADMDAYLEGVARIPELEPGLVTKATTQEAEVYLGGGRRLTLGLAQMSWAREFRNANWKGPAPRRVSDVVSAGDLIRLRQDDKGEWEIYSITSVT